MYFVYVLECTKTREYYKGISNNLGRRLIQHFNGKVQSTRNQLPLRLIHVEFFETRTDARKMEKFLKSGYGREIIKEIGDNLPRW